MMEKLEKTNLSIRKASAEDVPLILKFIKELSIYEKMSKEVVATKETLRKTLFGDKSYAQVLIAEIDQKPVGYALYFYNFSTFIGKPGIYIEDLYVNPEVRAKGIGKSLFSYIARLAVERKCCRLEWSVLHWNEPSISFYKKLGAEPKDEWIIYKMSGKALERLAGIYVQD